MTTPLVGAALAFSTIVGLGCLMGGLGRKKPKQQEKNKKLENNPESRLVPKSTSVQPMFTSCSLTSLDSYFVPVQFKTEEPAECHHEPSEIADIVITYWVVVIPGRGDEPRLLSFSDRKEAEECLKTNPHGHMCFGETRVIRRIENGLVKTLTFPFGLSPPLPPVFSYNHVPGQRPTFDFSATHPLSSASTFRPLIGKHPTFGRPPY